MFTPDDLDALRADSRAAMDASATIRRPPASASGTGGYGHAAAQPEVFAAAIPCRVFPTGAGKETAVGGTPAAEAPWTIQLDGVLFVRSFDVLEVAWLEGPLAGTSAVYEAVSADAPRSYAVNTRVACTLVS